MADEAFRVFELSLQGFSCSHILVMLALEAQGREVPDLVRAMSGLQGGFGVGRTCGTLSGACCLLGLYAGRGRADEREDDALPLMLRDLVEWFDATYGEQHGGTDCDDIIGGDPARRLATCSTMIVETFKKAVELLEQNGYALDAGKQGRDDE